MEPAITAGMLAVALGLMGGMAGAIVAVIVYAVMHGGLSR